MMATGVAGPGPAETPASACPLPPVRLRRLTPTQYARTAASFTGSAGEKLVPLGLLETSRPTPRGFSNATDGLDMPVPHVTRLVETAEALADHLLGAGGPLLGCGGADPACFAAALAKIGEKAWRRPLAAAEQDRYARFFAGESGRHGPQRAARQALIALFLSPEFLYRREGSGAATGGRVSLTAWERASALSYTLTDGPPDAELREAAASGRLDGREGVAAQARRLVRVQPTSSTLARFLEEHVGSAAVTTVVKDTPAAMKVFTQALADDLATETARFLEHLLWKDDARLSTLLLAPYTMVNARVAGLYGLPAPAGGGFQKIDLPPQQRLGLLTHGSLLAQHAVDEESDPVVRGLWVRETLLCLEVPAPPPNVNAVPPPPDGKRTARERLAKHNEDPICAGCHKLLDPIGYAFESYDGVGRFRTTDLGRPVNTSGAIHGTPATDGPLTDVFDLARRLARSPDAASCFVRKTYQFLHGQPPEASDECALRRIENRFVSGGGNILELVVDILTDDQALFRAQGG
jgi:hypothetical protein